MKIQRQSKILEIIQLKDVETQEELSGLLKEAGFQTTQATISRDIKELRLVKTLSGDKYKYSLPAVGGEAEHSVRLRTIFQEGVSSVEAAQNILVLKTLPGFASAACAALDTMNFSSLVGTLAGDDTALLILKNNTAAGELKEIIEMMMSRGQITGDVPVG